MFVTNVYSRREFDDREMKIGTSCSFKRLYISITYMLAQCQWQTTAIKYRPPFQYLLFCALFVQLIFFTTIIALLRWKIQLPNFLNKIWKVPAFHVVFNWFSFTICMLLDCLLKIDSFHTLQTIFSRGKKESENSFKTLFSPNKNKTVEILFNTLQWVQFPLPQWLANIFKFKLNLTRAHTKE